MNSIDPVVAAIAQALQQRGEWLGTAESCTGGLVAKWLTDRAGSSAWFERSLVTYSNRAKQELLGVAPQIFERHGAVSRECVAAMVQGLLGRAPLDWGIAISGIAGPGGGSADKPVGTVWIAWMQRQDAAPQCEGRRFAGGRAAVRKAAARHALEGLLQRLQERAR